MAVSDEDDTSQNNVASHIKQTEIDRMFDKQVIDSTPQSDVAGTVQDGFAADSEDTINRIDSYDEGECDTDVPNDERVDEQETAKNFMQESPASETAVAATYADHISANTNSDIDNDAVDAQLLAELVDDPVKADNIDSDGDPPLETLIPKSAIEPIDDSSSLHSIEGDQSSTDAAALNKLLKHEILFDESINNILLIAGSSDDIDQHLRLPTNQQCNTGVWSFASPVMRVLPARYFWSTSVYDKRTLAIFTNPDMIAILRPPTNLDEVNRLLALRGKHGSSTHDIHDYLVAESLIDPKTCKIRLSQLTTPTSIPLQDNSNDSLPLHRISNMNKNDNRKHTCFDILTPTETVTLSTAACLPSDTSEDLGGKTLRDTLRCELAIVSTIVKVHLSNFALGFEDDHAWKHQVILGTPHSYVVSGNDQMLKESLIAFQGLRNDREASKIDSFIIDAKDDSGKTALHYACTRRKVTTVRLLVEAGADCSIAQKVDDLTPCHICAKGLDEKVLSIVLSASHPTRPDPNAIDSHGKTPMYLAAVEGSGVNGRSNSEALDLCLSALEAWGGQFTVVSSKGTELLHPVHMVSARWKTYELCAILAHCKYRYPLLPGSSDSGCSLGSQFHYPIHASIASLRIFFHSADSEFNTEFMPVESALIKTLQTLLNHGFEPNERIEGVAGQGEAAKSLSYFIGFTPLQLLAAVAVEARSATDVKIRGAEEENHELQCVPRNMNNIIYACAELLLMNGARIHMPPPPTSRLNRSTPPGCYSLAMALGGPKATSSRDCFPLDRNEIFALFGGACRVNSSMKAFASKAIKIIGEFDVGNTSEYSVAPGGNDSSSCAICWSEFGIVANRKHVCRVSRKFVCHECSTKRVIVNGSEHRISDGQYLLALADAKRSAKKAVADQEERMRKHRQSVTQARESLGLEKKTNTIQSTLSETATTENNFKDRLANAISGIGQAKDAVLERGAKLENLAEKTDALEQASLDFANMAKELNRSQNSWW